MILKATSSPESRNWTHSNVWCFMLTPSWITLVLDSRSWSRGHFCSRTSNSFMSTTSGRGLSSFNWSL